MFFEDDEVPNSALAFSAQSQDGHSGGAAAKPTTLVLELIYCTENERNCPTILPYPFDLIKRVTAQLIRHEESADALEKQEQDAARDGSATSLLPFRPSDVVRVEHQRVKFFLSELLRTRLSKIEELCTAIVYEKVEEDTVGVPTMTPPSGSSSSGLRWALSPNELLVAEQLVKLRQDCMTRGALHQLPAPLQSLLPNLPHGEGTEILPVSDTDVYVFMLALEDLGVVQLAVDTTQDITAGEIFLLPYSVISHFVIEGRARLV